MAQHSVVELCKVLLRQETDFLFYLKKKKNPIQSKCWQHTSCLFFVSGSSVNANALPSGVNRRIRSIGICPSRKCGQTLDGDVSMAIVALMGHAGLVSDFFWPFFQ